MLRNLLLFTVVLGLIAGLTYWSNHTASAPPLAAAPEAKSVTAARPVPAFSVTDLAGRTHDIADYKGKVILLNFWASWCGPCLVEFPKMMELAEAYPDNLVWLAVSVDSQRDALTRFLEHFPATPENAIIGWDPAKAIAQDLFQSIRYPETILIGPDFKMHRKVVGDTDWTGNSMKAELEALLALKPAN